MSYTIVIVTAKTCKHCVKFRQDTLPGVIDALKSRNIRVYDVYLPDMRTPLPQDYPAVLNDYIGFVPAILAVPTQQWKNGNISNVYVFNGTRSSKGEIVATKGYPLNADGILAWYGNLPSTSEKVYTSGSYRVEERVR